MNVSYHYARTQAEIDAIYRLRYEVYVEEMHIFGEVADHQNRMLHDHNDEHGRLLYARVDGEIVASMRLNLGKDAPFTDELKQTYNLDRFLEAIEYDQLLVLTRFMVRDDYRGSSIAHQMICQVGELCLQEDIEISVCDCQPHLVRYYQRIGFRSYGCDVYNDPEFGIMIPLAFVNGDLDYLKAIRSPLQSIFERRTCNTPFVDRCVASIGEPAVQNIADINLENHTSLQDQIYYNTPLFEGLELNTIQSFINQGHLLNLTEGDRLIRKGQTAQTMFILLSGSLEVRDEDRLIGRLYPGAIVGELSLLLSTRRTTDVYVGERDTVLISLEESRLKKKLKSKSSSWLSLNLSKTLARKLNALTSMGPEKFVFPMQIQNLAC